MNTAEKDFKVKNGLQVNGDAHFNSNIILDNTPVSYDPISKRLKIFIDDNWEIIPIDSDINESTLDGGAI